MLLSPKAMVQMIRSITRKAAAITPPVRSTTSLLLSSLIVVPLDRVIHANARTHLNSAGSFMIYRAEDIRVLLDGAIDTPYSAATEQATDAVTGVR